MQGDTKYRRLTEPTDTEISRDLRGFANRQQPPPGGRQVAFVPSEVLLCLAASRVVKWNRYGGQNIHRVPSPVPEMAHLFKRPASSITAKMANLLGGRANQGESESDAAEWLLGDPQRLIIRYERILVCARGAGIGPDSLPDFLPRDAARWCRW